MEEVFSKCPRQSYLFLAKKIGGLLPTGGSVAGSNNIIIQNPQHKIGNKPETQCKSSLWAQQASMPPTIVPRAPPPRSQDLPEMEKRL